MCSSDLIDDLDAVAERDLTVSVLRAGEFRPELRTFWQDGIPRLRAKGIPDQSFVLMISTNLLQWSPLRTNQFGSTGSYLLSLTSSTNADAQRRFYKVTRLP